LNHHLKVEENASFLMSRPIKLKSEVEFPTLGASGPKPIPKALVKSLPAKMTNLGALYARWMTRFREMKMENIGMMSCSIFAGNMLPKELHLLPYSHETMKKNMLVDCDLVLEWYEDALLRKGQYNKERVEMMEPVIGSAIVFAASGDGLKPISDYDMARGEWFRHFSSPGYADKTFDQAYSLVISALYSDEMVTKIWKHVEDLEGQWTSDQTIVNLTLKETKNALLSIM
jgi:hypothetical protein